MAYDPSADRPPSPTEVRELYDATREYLIRCDDAFSLSKPTEPRAPNPHRAHADGTQFYGFPFLAVGDTLDVGTHFCASYPPNWRLRYKDLSLLHTLVPDAAEVLGLGDDLELTYHAPYIKYEGGSDVPQPDAQPEAPDCAFILRKPVVPGMPNLQLRLYKLQPDAYEPAHARGLRSDKLKGSPDVVRTPEGTVPLLGHTEWEVLTRVAGYIGLLEPESTARITRA